MNNTRLKTKVLVVAGQSPPSSAVSELAGGAPFLQGNAEFGALNPTARWQAVDAPKFARMGDILVSVRAPVGAVNVADSNYGIGRGLCAVRPRDIAARYLYWLMCAASGELNSLATGSTFTAVSASDIGNLAVPVTSRVDQDLVGVHLDRETAEIDAFIGDQEKLIELLTERRVATLQHALHLEMAHHRAVPEMAVRWGAELVQTGPFGSQIKSEEYVVGGVPLVNPMHMISGRISHSTDVTVTDNKAKELARHAIRAGDVLIARRGELGRCAVATSQDAGLLCGTGSLLLRLRPTLLDPDFFALVFSSQKVRHELLLASIGSTMDNLNASTVGSLRLPLLPLKTQRAVTAQATTEVADLDAAIADAREAIALSKERRAALISAAVTGKIDVRAHGKVDA